MVMVTVDLDAAVPDAEAQRIAPPPPGRARDDDAGGAHHHHARRASIQRAAETAAETVQTEAEPRAGVGDGAHAAFSRRRSTPRPTRRAPR